MCLKNKFHSQIIKFRMFRIWIEFISDQHLSFYFQLLNEKVKNLNDLAFTQLLVSFTGTLCISLNS